MPAKPFLLYLGLWAAFGAVHSVMAGSGFKARWRQLLGRLAPAERLIYNLIALLTLSLVMAVGHAILPHDPVFNPQGPALWGVQGVQLAGLGMLVYAVSHYDLALFAGLKQIIYARRGETPPVEPLRTSALHHYVRHPIYAACLPVIWARPMDTATLAANLFATAYFLIGMRLEENRLLTLYGEDYADYRKRVPALIPFLPMGERA